MKLLQPITLGLAIAASIASAALAVPRIPSSQSLPQGKPADFQGQGRTQPKPQVPQGLGGLGNRCPQGQVLSSWQKPIYDKDGLFVVGWETVATCVPVDLEPAG